MAVQSTIHYELATPADVTQLVSDLATVEAGTIVVAFLPSSEWQVSDLEIARVVAAARTWNKRLIAERGAGDLAERAVRFGFQDLAMVSDSPSPGSRDTNAFSTPADEKTAAIQQVEGVEADEELTRTIAKVDSSDDVTTALQHQDRFSSTADLATYRPATRQSTGDDGDAPKSGKYIPAPVRLRPAPPAPAIRQPGNSLEASTAPVGQRPGPTRVANPQPVRPDDQTVVGALDNAPARRHSRFLKIGAAVLAPVLVLAVVAALALYMLPTADITLVPHEDRIASNLTYGVATTNADFDISVDPTPLTTTSTAEATREATGERWEPAGTASGIVQITNPLTNEVTIPAGTELPGSNGITYYTAEDVRLPAADPYGSMSFGSGTVGVYAGVIGPDGNLDAGSLTGQLGTQMFYTNPNAIGGGRLDRFSVITEGDIAAVREQVQGELAEKAEGEFEAEIPAGFHLVPGTLEFGEPDIAVDASAGEDGEQVSASGSVSVTAKLYDPDELHELAGSEADRQLARQGGSERILLAETVALQEPRALGSDTPGYQINVEAIARTVITDAERATLIDQMAGLSREEAEELLENHPKVDRYEITVEPNWFLDRMPEIASRINIHVSSGEPTASR